MVSFSPALGSRASVPSRTVFQFLAVAAQGQINHDAALEVWTNLSGEWREHIFSEHVSPFGKLLVAGVHLVGEGDYHFTYRIREASGNIIWLSKAGGNDNGHILVKTAPPSSDTFDPLLLARNHAEIIQNGSSNNASTDISSRTIKYTLTDGQEGEVESFRLISLGGWSSGLSIERSKPTWFTARSLDAFNGLSPHFDCQLLLYQSGSQVVACFPLSLSDASSTLRGCIEGSDTVWLRSERESSRTAQAQCVVAWGPEDKLLGVIDACLDAAKLAIDKDGSLNDDALANGHVPKSSWSLHETKKAVYCTWNSLGQDYTFSGVTGRLGSLKTQGSLQYFESLLLDDGWQDVARSPENQNLRGLRSFGLRDGWLDESLASEEGESKLAGVVRTLKQRFPEIKTVGVWMTLEGYWNGIHPDSELSRTYKLTRYGVTDSNAQIPYPPPSEHIYLPAPEDTERYWIDYFTSLKQAGVDFVKIDNQAALDYLVGEGASTMRYHISRTARKAARDIFGPGNLINCMAGSPRYYNDFLSKRSPAASSLRTSDDFFPNEPDSHRFHIAHNATTAFLDRKLSVTRDFDMFTTHHALADYHALLRCCTTAPMYITDSEPSNQKVFRRTGGTDVTGSYHIIKALSNKSVRLPSTAFTDVTGNGDGLALKVVLPVPTARGAILCMWNCRGEGGTAVDAVMKKEVMEALNLISFGDNLSKGYIVMHEPSNLHVIHTSESGRSDAAEMIAPVSLSPGSTKTITVVDIQSFSNFEMAVLGLADKYVGLCSVLSIEERTVSTSPSSQAAESEPMQSKIVPEVEQPESTQETTPESDKPVAEAPQPVSETTPILQPASTPSGCRSGSRLLALLLFYRRDLSQARAAFLRDFWRSPFVTLFREIRAALGGPSTLPNASEDRSTARSPTEDAAPDMQEAPKAIPETYGTMSNGTSANQQEGDLSVASESSNATAVNDAVEERDEVVVRLSVAGTLVLWIPDFAIEEYIITLQGQEVASKVITASGACVQIDMETAAQALLKAGVSYDSWHIGVSKR